jgi:hypothetical protein
MSKQQLRGQSVSAGLSAFDAGFQFLVRCPACDARATVIGGGLTNAVSSRFICCQCGKVKEARATGFYGGTPSGPPVDPYMRLPLWLQRPCCGKTLWAYNLSHVTFLEEYVGQTHRSRRLSQNLLSKTPGVRPERLPQWMKSAKNREEIIQGLALLRAVALATD